MLMRCRHAWDHSKVRNMLKRFVAQSASWQQQHDCIDLNNGCVVQKAAACTVHKVIR